MKNNVAVLRVEELGLDKSIHININNNKMDVIVMLRRDLLSSTAIIKFFHVCNDKLLKFMFISKKKKKKKLIKVAFDGAVGSVLPTLYIKHCPTNYLIKKLIK